MNPRVNPEANKINFLNDFNELVNQLNIEENKKNDIKNRFKEMVSKMPSVTYFPLPSPTDAGMENNPLMSAAPAIFTATSIEIINLQTTLDIFKEVKKTIPAENAVLSANFNRLASKFNFAASRVTNEVRLDEIEQVVPKDKDDIEMVEIARPAPLVPVPVAPINLDEAIIKAEAAREEFNKTHGDKHLSTDEMRDKIKLNNAVVDILTYQNNASYDRWNNPSPSGKTVAQNKKDESAYQQTIEAKIRLLRNENTHLRSEVENANRSTNPSTPQVLTEAKPSLRQRWDKFKKLFEKEDGTYDKARIARFTLFCFAAVAALAGLITAAVFTGGALAAAAGVGVGVVIASGSSAAIIAMIASVAIGSVAVVAAETQINGPAQKKQRMQRIQNQIRAGQEIEMDIVNKTLTQQAPQARAGDPSLTIKPSMASSPERVDSSHYGKKSRLFQDNHQGKKISVTNNITRKRPSK